MFDDLLKFKIKIKKYYFNVYYNWYNIAYTTHSKTTTNWLFHPKIWKNEHLKKTLVLQEIWTSWL